MECYEFAAYGTLFSFAKATGQKRIADLLSQNLQEEKEAGARLTEISESVNQDANRYLDPEEEQKTEKEIRAEGKSSS